MARLYEWSSRSGCSSPCQYGPHTGSALTYRAGSHADQRRRMFRFLATPLPDCEAGPGRKAKVGSKAETANFTVVAVPHFTYDLVPEGLVKGSDEYKAAAEEVVIQDDEDEREVDLLDVMIQTYPKPPIVASKKGKRPLSTSNNGPYRDSFLNVLQALPTYEKSLNRLWIQLADWREWVKLMLLSTFGVFSSHLDRMYMENEALEEALDAICFAFVEDPADSLTWEAFDAVVARTMVRSLLSPDLKHS